MPTRRPLTSRRAITSTFTTAEKQLRATIQKAFGAASEIHIKDSGPSWVNSPKINPGDLVSNPIAQRQFTVSVRAATIRTAGRPESIKAGGKKAGAKKAGAKKGGAKKGGAKKPSKRK